MTDQELKDLAASNTINIKKLEAIQAKVSAEVAKISIKLQKAVVQGKKTSAEVEKAVAQGKKTSAEAEKAIAERKETSAEVKETTRVLKALGLNVDGINKSTGQETEAFFYSSLKRNPCLGNIKFDFVDANVCRSKGGNEHEMDVFLENGDSVGIVETKNKVKKDHIAQLDKIIALFPLFHPTFKGHKIHGAIAGKIFPKHLQSLALKKGYYVLTQQGDHIEQRMPY
jgi:hypothetical protein